MYISKHVGVLELTFRGWRILLLVLFVATSATVFYQEYLREHIDVHLTVVTALAGALSLFVAFFTAQAYDRWWEARKIWGTIVNDSRSFGRMVVSFFDGSEPEITALRRRLVRRHIAHLYAVKERLRGEKTQEYAAYLGDDEKDRAGRSPNAGNTVLELQGRELNAAQRADHIDLIRLAMLNDMLNRFSTSMGMAERIKLTVFPAHYAAMIRVSIWASLLVFSLALSDEVGYWAVPFATLLGTVFAMIYEIGHGLLDPFEGAPTDTPMASIVRTIEINLLEQIGEEQLPGPVESIDGLYLM